MLNRLPREIMKEKPSEAPSSAWSSIAKSVREISVQSAKSTTSPLPPNSPHTAVPIVANRYTTLDASIDALLHRIYRNSNIRWRVEMVVKKHEIAEAQHDVAVVDSPPPRARSAIRLVFGLQVGTLLQQ